MNNLIWISGLVGIFLPHLIAIVSQSHWSSGTKSIFAFATCLIAAAVTSYFAGTLNFHDLAGSFSLVFALAQTSYKGLWKPTGIADAVESSTDVTEPSF